MKELFGALGTVEGVEEHMMDGVVCRVCSLRAPRTIVPFMPIFGEFCSKMRSCAFLVRSTSTMIRRSRFEAVSGTLATNCQFVEDLEYLLNEVNGDMMMIY